MTWGDWLLVAYMAIGCAFADRIMIDLARKRAADMRRQPLRVILASTSIAVVWGVLAILGAIEDRRK